MMQRKTWVILASAAVLVGAGYFATRKGKEEIKWRQAAVMKGPIRQRITATGTLSALVQVNVGTQASGTVAALFVDYNSQVKKGQTIAQIDPTLAQTSVLDTSANVAKAESTLTDAMRQLERAKRLFQSSLIAQQDLDDKQTQADRAKGDLLSAKATLEKAKANLGYCTIQAPVSGVVVSRAVDVGQTVAASFSTPTLFVIAQDLTKMKVEASIDEADIGQVEQGQSGLFTVDSYPDTQFKGRVSQVRLEPITAQNVVSYKVVIEVDNTDLKLRPGMTASVSITTQSKDVVLKVPSSALRFNPMAFLPASEAPGGGGAAKGADKGAGKGGDRGGMGVGGSQGGRPGGVPQRGLVAKREDRLWVLKDGRPVALSVKAGISDGQFTEVTGEGISEGLQILVGIEEKRASGSATQPLTGGPGGGGPRR